VQQGRLELTDDAEPATPALTHKEVIAEVAKRHKVLLTKGDPVLLVLTALEVIAARMVDRMSAKLTASEDQIAARTAQQIAASQAYVEKTVNAGVEFYSRRLAQGSADLAKTFAEEAKGVLEPFRLQLEADRLATVQSERRAVLAAIVAATGAGVTLIAAAVILLRI
jgi:hypothetical protein